MGFKVLPRKLKVPAWYVGVERRLTGADFRAFSLMCVLLYTANNAPGIINGPA